MTRKLHVEVVSDVVCPWCYVGKRRLEKAIASRPELEIAVTWQPFQLSPDMPREGKDRVEHYSQIFGEARARQIMSSMQDTGVEEGIAFGNKPGARSPNTLSAHALMVLARSDDNVDSSELAEQLFAAHHVDCKDVGDIDVLTGLAAAAGMDTEGLAARLEVAEAEVSELIQESVARGVSGVPFFIVEGRYGISGAQPAETLAAAFEQIAAEATSAE